MKDYFYLLSEAEHVMKFTDLDIEIPDSTATDPETGEPLWQILVNGRTHRLPMPAIQCVWFLWGIHTGYITAKEAQ